MQQKPVPGDAQTPPGTVTGVILSREDDEGSSREDPSAVDAA
jgi:hypothetical protein